MHDLCPPTASIRSPFEYAFQADNRLFPSSRCCWLLYRSSQHGPSAPALWLLLGGILLVYYIMSRYTVDQVLELFLVLGTGTIASSICFCALPFRNMALISLGGHDTVAWKGIFMAKNYLGNSGAVFSYRGGVLSRGRTLLMASCSGPGGSRSFLCLIAIVFSRAATAMLAAADRDLYWLSHHHGRVLRGLRKK